MWGGSLGDTACLARTMEEGAVSQGCGRRPGGAGGRAPRTLREERGPAEP